MDERMFLELLKVGEGPTLDYKSEQYRWDDYGRASLIKDIVCMANTPRDVDSYILIGAKKVSDQLYEPVDVPVHYDGAKLQDLVKSWVHPVPRFYYQTFMVQGKRCGAITIKPVRQGPAMSREDLADGYMRRRVTYWRRADQNDEARPDELVEIVAWCNPGRLPNAVQLQPGADSLWAEFISATDGFERGHLYMLIAGPMQAIPQGVLSNLGLLDWDLVLDFDCDTEKSGLAKAASPVMEERRIRHLLRIGDRNAINVGRATYWFAARGLSDMPSTMCEPTWIKWNAKYYGELQAQMQSLAAASPRPCTVVILSDEAEYVRSACTAVSAAFGDKAAYVFVGANTGAIVGVSEQFTGTVIPIDLHRLCTELGAQFDVTGTSGGSDAAQDLPVRSGGTYSVPPKDAGWLSEEMDIVYLSAGTSQPGCFDVCRDYLRGHDIPWFALGMHYDVDRDLTSRVSKQVARDLEDRVATRVNLYHAAGAGGTTIAKRVVWDTHHDYPCVVVCSCRPAETVARLRYMFSKTSQPILAVIEGSQVKENDSEDLFNLCRSQQVPVVFLNVLRRFTPVQSRDRTFYLPAALSDAETARFAHAYEREAPHRAGALAKIADLSDHRLRTPFYFGLEAFEENFAGLPSYIQARLADATSEQKEVLCFLALAHHYAQRGLNAQLFASTLHIPKDRRVQLEKVLPIHMQELLVGDPDGNWRPAHDLIAMEIIQQVLCPDQEDRRAWREGLSSWGCRFAEFCCDEDPVQSDEIMETLSRCFVLRDNRDLLGTESAVTTRFSQWVEDTPPVGRLPLLQKLTELFPDAPHFWAHLGRYYSIEAGDPDKALESVDRAIRLSPEDPVLYHMKGMVLRKKTYDLMVSGPGSSDPKEVLPDVVRLAADSASEFSLSREFAPDSEHGYISHIQLITRVIDYAFRASGSDDRAKFLTSGATNIWIRESLDEAEDLLDQVRRLREGQDASEFEQRCRNEVQALYGSYDLALQGWDSLLSKPGIYKPPVRRQLVRTYLARQDRSWEKLEEREVKRIVTLLEDNMLEEPNENRNLRLWMQAIRRLSQAPPLESVIERVSYWKARSDTLEASFYLYVLYSLNAIEGSPLGVLHAGEVLDDCRKKAKERRNRTVSLEWIGHGQALSQLVHHSRLGEWDKAIDFWQNPDLLARVKGRVSRISGPEAGQIELICGLKAFFVPGKSGDVVDGKRNGLVAGRDENQAVTAFLGFSYDGPRAWDVRLSE